MEAKDLETARLEDSQLHILREAESAINQQRGTEGKHHEEVYLIALKRR